jgi:DNA-binding LytR/AlgR family response regulator
VALSHRKDIDLVFSDVMMPGGMSGVELARLVRKRSPPLPVILTTGYIEAAREAVEEGVIILAKPCQVESLSEAIRGHLQKVS